MGGSGPRPGRVGGPEAAGSDRAGSGRNAEAVGPDGAGSGRDAEAAPPRAPPGRGAATPRTASSGPPRRGEGPPPPPANSEPPPPRLAGPAGVTAARPIRGDGGRTALCSFASSAAIGWAARPAGVPWGGGEGGGRAQEQPETAPALIGGSPRRRHAGVGLLKSGRGTASPPTARTARGGVGAAICIEAPPLAYA